MKLILSSAEKGNEQDKLEDVAVVLLKSLRIFLLLEAGTCEAVPPKAYLWKHGVSLVRE